MDGGSDAGLLTRSGAWHQPKGLLDLRLTRGQASASNAADGLQQ